MWTVITRETSNWESVPYYKSFEEDAASLQIDSKTSFTTDFPILLPTVQYSRVSWGLSMRIKSALNQLGFFALIEEERKTLAL